MDLTEPAAALVPGLTAALLPALASRTGGATPEQLRRVAGRGTPAGVRRALERLAEHGLVNSVRVGAASAMYEINREHILYPVVQALLDADHALTQRLSDALATWDRGPMSAALFGSAARGDGDARSDIDLLVVRPADLADDEPSWVDQLHQLRSQVLSWTGNHLQILERTEDELTALARDGEPIFDELRRDAVSVFGTELRVLLGELR